MRGAAMLRTGRGVKHSFPGYGALAQLGERVLCKHEVVGSIPTGSTTLRLTATRGAAMGRVDGLPLRRRLTGNYRRPRNIALHAQLTEQRRAGYLTS
jgi:hypothetical protein